MASTAPEATVNATSNTSRSAWRSTNVSGSVFVANFSLTSSAVFLIILLSSSYVQRQKRSSSGGHLPEPVRTFRRLLVRRTRYRLLVRDRRVPIRRRRVITADASLGPRLAGICRYLPAPVRVPGWRGDAKSCQRRWQR